ncbi:Hypothetical protein FKW44_017570, partial [Caligus rogercresseyi]
MQGRLNFPPVMMPLLPISVMVDLTQRILAETHAESFNPHFHTPTAALNTPNMPPHPSFYEIFPPEFLDVPRSAEISTDP